MKKIILGFSIALNAVLLLIFISAAFIKTASLSFYDPDEEYGGAITSAVLVSFPQDAGIIFNPVEISLKTGQKAALQFSAVINKKQVNRLFETLYDREIIEVTTTGYGLLITALKSGDCAMQTLTELGIKNIAVIRVSE
jgi:hypothetical protein